MAKHSIEEPPPVLELIIYHNDGGDTVSCSDDSLLHSLSSQPDQEPLLESRWEIDHNICESPDFVLKAPQRQKTQESETVKKRSSDSAFILFAPMYPFMGVSVYGGFGQLLYDTSMLLSGVILALIYYSPVSEYFRSQNLTSQASGTP